MDANEPNLFKLLFWELKDPYGRFNYLSWLLRNIPGQFGIRLRRRWLGKYFGAFGRHTAIHPGVKLRNVHEVSIGDNVGIGEDVFIQGGGGLVIGNNVSLGPGVKIWTQNHEFGETGPVNDEAYEYKKVIIEDDVWIGASSFIMPGVRLPQGCVVSAGSVVGVKLYPPYSVIAGNPARVVRLRTTTNDQKREKTISEELSGSC